MVDINLRGAKNIAKKNGAAAPSEYSDEKWPTPEHLIFIFIANSKGRNWKWSGWHDQ